MKPRLDLFQVKDFKLINTWSLANKLELLILPYLIIPIIYSYFSPNNFFVGREFQEWIQFTLITGTPLLLIPIIALFAGERGYRFEIFLDLYIFAILIATLMFEATGIDTFDPKMSLIEGFIMYGSLVIFVFPIAMGVLYSIYREVEIYIIQFILIQNVLDRYQTDIFDLRERIDEQTKLIDYLKDVREVIIDHDAN